MRPETDGLWIGKTSDEQPFVLPYEAVTQTFAYLGKRGVGKTHALAVLIEEMLHAGLQAEQDIYRVDHARIAHLDALSTK